MALDIIEKALEAIAFILLYFFIGFGPGFIVGVILANVTVGRGKPLRMDTHQEKMARAGEHNKQWDPSDPRWQ